MVRISVFGLGYVGSVTAGCFAREGVPVVGVDISSDKVEQLNAGRSPIVEAQMDEVVAEARRRGNLRATTDVADALRNSDVSFVSVATPSQSNGKLDLTSIEKVCREIGRALKDKDSFHTVVIRSTVLPGTCAGTVIPALESASGKRLGVGFAVCSNPEFMREGTAVHDFFQPPMTVIGADDTAFFVPLDELYERIPGKQFRTSLGVAEMVKYACNAYHALKVAFANEIGTVCTTQGVDAAAVADIFCADTKLNVSAAYLKPGFAFGGSCLPKDVRALTYRGKELDLELPLLDAILPSNVQHMDRAFQSVMRTGRKKVGLLGLSFKAGTDDLRESPSVTLIKQLLGEGREIRIWDDQVALGRLVGSNRKFIDEYIPHIGSLLCEELDEVLANSEVVLLGTHAVDKAALVEKLAAGQILIDLVRMAPLSPPGVVKKAGDRAAR